MVEEYLLAAKVILVFALFLIAMLIAILADLWVKTRPVREKKHAAE